MKLCLRDAKVAIFSVRTALTPINWRQRYVWFLWKDLSILSFDPIEAANSTIERRIHANSNEMFFDHKLQIVGRGGQFKANNILNVKQNAHHMLANHMHDIINKIMLVV